MESNFWKFLGLVIFSLVMRDCYIKYLGQEYQSQPKIIVTIPADCVGVMAKGKVLNGAYPCKGVVGAKWEARQAEEE